MSDRRWKKLTVKPFVTPQALGVVGRWFHLDEHEDRAQQVNRRLHWAWLGALVGGFLILVVGRLYFVQVLAADLYNNEAISTRYRYQQIPAPRGQLISQDGMVLADNVPRYTATLHAPDIDADRLDDLVMALTRYLPSLEAEALAEWMQNFDETDTNTWVVWDDVPVETAQKMQVDLALWPGFHLEVQHKRAYHGGPAFSHVVGYTGKLTSEEWAEVDREVYSLADSIGKAGLELFYESALKGLDGSNIVEVDAWQSVVAELGQEPAIPGEDLVLHLEAEWQQQIRDIMLREMKSRGLEAGAVVALGPQGQVKALVSLPDYDHNVFVNPNTRGEQIEQWYADENKPLYQRAIAGTYPSGSTLKPLVASAGLAEGIITPNTIVQSTGGVEVGGSFFPDWRAGGHGPTNLERAISDSVNTYFYRIGAGGDGLTGLGIETLAQYLSDFGLGAATGIDLFGEQTGLIPNPDWKKYTLNERWYLGDLLNLSIGQGYLQLTPLQLANAINSIANGGYLYQPQIVQRIGNTEVTPELIRQIPASEADLSAVRSAMHATSTIGSTKRLGQLPFTVGAKTGSAQFGQDQIHSWLVAFAPVEDPQITVAILMEDGAGGGYDTQKAMYEILEAYFK